MASAATTALLGVNPLSSWKQTSRSSPIQFFRHHLRPLSSKPLQFNAVTSKPPNPSLSSFFFAKPKYDHLKLKCSSSSDHSSQTSPDPLWNILSDIFSNCLKDIPKDDFPNALNEKLVNALKVLKTPAMAAVLFSFLLTLDPNSAGGRIGGSSFSSRSSSSSSSSGSSSSSSSSRSSSSSSSDSSPSYSSSSYSSSSYSSSSPSSSSSSEKHNQTKPSSSSSSSEEHEETKSSSSSSEEINNILLAFRIISFVCILILLALILRKNYEMHQSAGESTLNVVKLQIGLLGSAQTLQKELDRIAGTADTSTPEGLSYVLTEATVALLRLPDYWISSYSSVTPTRSMEDAEKCFNKTSIEERAKFDEETLVNVNNKKRRDSTSKDAGQRNEYIVVTLLIALEGKCKLPTINKVADLTKALQDLGSIPSKNILAAEVLWTPQQENDTLSEEELMEDYPLLKSF